MITLSVPLPPSANRYWRIYRGRAVKAEAARAYVAEVAVVCHQAGVEPLTGAVSVRVIIYFDSRRGDLDNRLKILLDALNGLAWLDDAQIVELYARRELDRRNPRVELTVTEFVKRA